MSKPPKIGTREAGQVLTRASIAGLSKAIAETERDHPLPRCRHGKPLIDGAGEILEPPCGCRYQDRNEQGTTPSPGKP